MRSLTKGNSWVFFAAYLPKYSSFQPFFDGFPKTDRSSPHEPSGKDQEHRWGILVSQCFWGLQRMQRWNPQENLRTRETHFPSPFGLFCFFRGNSVWELHELNSSRDQPAQNALKSKKSWREIPVWSPLPPEKHQRAPKHIQLLREPKWPRGPLQFRGIRETREAAPEIRKRNQRACGCGKPAQNDHWNIPNRDRGIQESPQRKNEGIQKGSQCKNLAKTRRKNTSVHFSFYCGWILLSAWHFGCLGRSGSALWDPSQFGLVVFWEFLHFEVKQEMKKENQSIQEELQKKKEELAELKTKLENGQRETQELQEKLRNLEVALTKHEETSQRVISTTVMNHQIALTEPSSMTHKKESQKLSKEKSPNKERNEKNSLGSANKTPENSKKTKKANLEKKEGLKSPKEKQSKNSSFGMSQTFRSMSSTNKKHGSPSISVADLFSSVIAFQNKKEPRTKNTRNDSKKTSSNLALLETTNDQVPKPMELSQVVRRQESEENNSKIQRTTTTVSKPKPKEQRQKLKQSSRSICHEPLSPNLFLKQKNQGKNSLFPTHGKIQGNDGYSGYLYQTILGGQTQEKGSKREVSFSQKMPQERILRTFRYVWLVNRLFIFGKWPLNRKEHSLGFDEILRKREKKTKFVGTGPSSSKKKGYHLMKPLKVLSPENKMQPRSKSIESVKKPLGALNPCERNFTCIES